MQCTLSRILPVFCWQLLVVLAVSNTAWSQGTYLVNPADATAYHSITDAALAATASGLSTTVIQIEGIPDYLNIRS